MLVWLVGFAFAKESVTMPSVEASADPGIIEQGRYLASAVAQCTLCHGSAAPDGLEPTDPTLPQTGGLVWRVPGFVTMVASNITADPDLGVGGWSDEELARTIRYGVGPDERLRPLMYFHVGPMSDIDLTALVSWVRSLEGAPSEVAEQRLSFLGKLFLSSIDPRNGKAPMMHVAGGEASVERGRYLAEGPANCGMCHSPMKGLQQVEPRFSGGTRAEPDLHEKGWEWLAPNLTPHPTTGRIASWSEDQFVARFREGADPSTHPIMPWNAYRHMTDQDLRSLYRYFQSLPPTEHETGPGHREKGWKPPRE